MNTIFNSKSNNNKNDLLFIAYPILFIFFYIIEVLADGVTILDPYKESFLAFIL